MVDFAPHKNEFLRDEHQHRRLGFDGAEIAGIFREAGIELVDQQKLKSEASEGGKLTVSIWVGRDPRLVTDDLTGSGAAIA
ncbi:MAG: hypothetical protein KDJ29_10505 [Hyphomicrobiales bacterium]|nr:hypothetical protein [Hyphomicrobiales bacterium]